ncbi:hypothetical protein BGZ82_004407, partial [Podila clonocystis]
MSENSGSSNTSALPLQGQFPGTYDPDAPVTTAVLDAKLKHLQSQIIANLEDLIKQWIKHPDQAISTPTVKDQTQHPDYLIRIDAPVTNTQPINVSF